MLVGILVFIVFAVGAFGHWYDKRGRVKKMDRLYTDLQPAVEDLGLILSDSFDQKEHLRCISVMHGERKIVEIKMDMWSAQGGDYIICIGSTRYAVQYSFEALDKAYKAIDRHYRCKV